MRYIVAEGAVGPNGRTVRCANCNQQWFQEGEVGLDEALFDEENETFPAYAEEETAEIDLAPADLPGDTDFQSILQKEIEQTPIPEGVRPVQPEHDPVLAQLGSQPGPKKPVPVDKISGYLLAFAFWLGILAVILMLHPQISRAWPPSNMLFSMVGLKPVPPGEGLGLDSLHAEIAHGKIRMTGNVNNLREEDMKVPSIMATIVDADGKMIDQVLIAPPVARLKAEGQASFDVNYPKIPQGAANVTFAFSFIKVEPAEEGTKNQPEEPAPTQPHR